MGLTPFLPELYSFLESAPLRRGDNNPMTTLQAITKQVKVLPEPARREVLHFAEFLQAMTKANGEGRDDQSWAEFSLSSAMRGMEGKPSLYTSADLKESLR